LSCKYLASTAQAKQQRPSSTSNGSTAVDVLAPAVLLLLLLRAALLGLTSLL
jgi:hypothetical protein